jgi:hypothetical protein
MKPQGPDRVLTRRHTFGTPLGVRIWKSGLPGQNAKLGNLSEKGIFFATNAQLSTGATVKIWLSVRRACCQVARPKTPQPC